MDMVGTQESREVAFVAGSRSGENFGTDPAGDLNRCDSHAASRSVNEDAFPAPKPRQVHQRMPSGEKRRRNGGGGLKGNSRRLGHHGRNRGHGMARKRGGCKGDDFVPGAEAVGLGPCGHHHSGKLHSERRAREPALQRLVGQEPHGKHDIAKIQTRGANLDLHFACIRSASGSGFPFEILERSRGIEVENRRRIRPGGVFGKRNAGDQTPCRSKSNLVLGVAGQNFLCKKGDVFRLRRLTFAVDAPHPELGELVSSHAGKAP